MNDESLNDESIAESDYGRGQILRAGLLRRRCPRTSRRSTGPPPVGPRTQWPAELRWTLELCLAAQPPIAIYWGDALTLLYNDAWRTLIGDKHPAALGRPGREVFAEIWTTLELMFGVRDRPREAAPTSTQVYRNVLLRLHLEPGSSGNGKGRRHL